jgi:hypothetical protein
MRFFFSAKIIFLCFFSICLFSSDGSRNKVMPIRSWSIQEGMKFKMRAIRGGAYFNSCKDIEKDEIKDVYLYAVEQKELDIIAILHDLGQQKPIFSISSTERFYSTRDTLLHVAARKGDQETVRVLLDCGLCGSEKNEDGQTAAQVALEWGHLDVAEMIKKSVPTKSFHSLS